jgi:uncharacterized membrane protein
MTLENVEKWIEVAVPVRTAYNQWTQFEEFPLFMDGVKSVTQMDETLIHWVADVGGRIKEWDAEISEQVPDERIAWRSQGGTPNAGVVTFHRIHEDRTRIMLQLQYDPEDFIDQAGDWLGFLDRTVQKDLDNFKEFIEARGEETGAWRGKIEHRS